MEKAEFYRREENKELMLKLVGKVVVGVEHYWDGSWEEGWNIIFDDGTILTANDGEYGDDAFRFLK